MKHEFIISENNILYTYDKYEDIPLVFDHLIKFFPDIPPEPHTKEQHDEIDKWPQLIQDLLKRERNASSNKNR